MFSLAGNAQQAALIVPIFLGLFASFSGVLVPYAQITAFWRYWIYYLNPWTYSLGGQVFYAMRDIPVVCKAVEFAQFPAPNGQTCGEYLQPFLAQIGQGYVDNPDSTGQCRFCTYSNGNQVSPWSDEARTRTDPC
jgi:ATP-binding cassette subfamily G (WHITE) protein 2 (SNQ2)